VNSKVFLRLHHHDVLQFFLAQFHQILTDPSFETINASLL
jgi:hypothetical protein